MSAKDGFLAGPGPTQEQELSAATITEAAAWVARLHSPLRTPAVERGFRSWLDEDADHSRAFELVTDSWDEVATLKSAANFDITVPSDGRQPLGSVKGQRRFLPLALAATLALAVAGALFFLLRDSAVTTGIGEQRLLSLEDGSRVYLNTLTRLSVDYTEIQRGIRLESGEALFEVAKDAGRPFVVEAGGRRIQALGTSFVVRRDAQRTAVTLVDGKVSVKELSTSAPAISSTVLEPGERVTYVQNTPRPKIDRPVLEKLTAWQRGKVPIENLSLSDAVTEMNRYSKVQLSIERPEARDLRVSGIFRVGDSLSFARSVAEAYGLEVEEDGERIRIGGVPR